MNQIAAVGAIFELCMHLPGGFGALPTAMHADLAAALSNTEPRVCSAAIPIFAGVAGALQSMPASLMAPRPVTRMVALVRRFIVVGGGDATEVVNVLTILSATCRSHGDLVVKFGAVSAVLDALRAFSESRNTLFAIGALHVIMGAVGFVGEKLTGDDDLSRGVMQQTIATGWEHRSDADVAAAVAGTLWNLARVRYQAVIAARGVPLLMELMEVHSSVALVQERAMIALSNCVHWYDGSGSPTPHPDGVKLLQELEEGALALVLTSFGNGLTAAVGASWSTSRAAGLDPLLSAATQVIACLSRGMSDADANRAISLLCNLLNRLVHRVLYGDHSASGHVCWDVGFRGAESDSDALTAARSRPWAQLTRREVQRVGNRRESREGALGEDCMMLIFTLFAIRNIAQVRRTCRGWRRASICSRTRSLN